MGSDGGERGRIEEKQGRTGGERDQTRRNGVGLGGMGLNGGSNRDRRAKSL